MAATRTTLLYLFVFTISLKTVYAIQCYQCSGSDSESPFDCNEYLEGDTDLQPKDCSTIHNAQHCIKYVGRYEGLSLDCYQCNSSSTMECGDGLLNLDGGVLMPTSCQHVYNAQYCIKQTGGISTKRYCSSLDLGNYCNYVHQVGDKLEYRTCIYTCSTDGCNAATGLKASIAIVIPFLFIVKFVINRYCRLLY